MFQIDLSQYLWLSENLFKMGDKEAEEEENELLETNYKNSINNKEEALKEKQTKFQDNQKTNGVRKTKVESVIRVSER